MSRSSNRIGLLVGVGSTVLWIAPATAQQAARPLQPAHQETAIPVPEGVYSVGRSPYGSGVYYAGPGYSSFNDRRTQERTFGIGRQTERYKQNAAEAERRLYAYQLRQGLAVPHPYAYSESREAFPRVYGAPWDSFYTYGRELEHYRQREFAAREELTYLTQHDYLLRGLGEFRAGAYGAAARSFMAAADLDHGDSASRMHAGQALVATGLYEQAITYFRRGFELQIRLLNTPLDFQADYGRKADYFEHVNRVESFCRAHPEDGRAWLLLALERFFGPEPASAAEAMRKVQKLLGKDDLANRLLQAAEPVLQSEAPSKDSASAKKSRFKT